MVLCDVFKVLITYEIFQLSRFHESKYASTYF